MKLSKRNLKLAEQLQEQIGHHALIIARKKAECKYLPDWYKVKPVAWYEGAMEACEGSLNSLLMEHGCYEGFRTSHETSKQFGVEYRFNYYFLSSAK